MWPGTIRWRPNKYAREHESRNKMLRATYQFRESIFHALIMRLCFHVGDTTFGAHAPEVLFCVEQSLLQ